MMAKWLWMVVTVVLVNEWYHNHCCYGCLEQERIALLHLKASFNSFANPDCCKWDGIECNKNTKRVIKLYLYYVREEYWYLNASLFLPFQELKSLDLSGNNIAGCTENQGFGVLSSLRNLEYLDLSYNHFNDSILSGLRGLSSLKSLDLSYTNLTGSVNINGLRKLKLLRLDGVNFNNNILLQSLGALPCLKTLSAVDSNFETQVTSQEFYNLTNIEGLFLDRAYLPADFLQSIGALSALKFLSLAECNLSGTLPPKGWCELKNLEELYLIVNDLEGLLPLCLGNLSSLRLLDITGNRLTGNIASNPLANLTSLEYLDLSDNHLQVPLSFKLFMNHSNLKSISCDNNQLIPDPTFQTCAPKFQLKYFSVSNCTSKALNPEIPNFLYSQYDLIFLDLSHNNFSGMFPSWLLENNTRLEELYLNDNSFIGPLQLPNHPNSYLSRLDVSVNNIHGQIPRNMCLIFPQLRFLMMACNGLTGSIPQCFGNISSLGVLDLSNNQLSGGIPEKLINNQLWYVKLSNNNLDGQISPSVFNSSSLRCLYLNGNNFTGQLLDNSWYSSSSLFDLVTLDLRDNNLIGPIPNWIGRLQSLRFLLLRGNHFDGDLPVQLCLLKQLGILDLSKNNFSGPLPSCLSNLTFEASQEKAFVEYDVIQLGTIIGENIVEFAPKGSSYAYKGDILNFMSGIDLSCNRFSGEIPSELGNLSEIRALNLSHNNLNGSIPTTFSNLKQIESLDLSYNNLNGEIPPELIQLNTLEVFSVAYNNLSGQIPERKDQFETLEVFSVEGNLLLCGPPLDNNCSELESPSPPMPNDSKGEREDDDFIDMYVFFVTFGVSYIIILLGIIAVLYINPYWRGAWFYFIEMFIDNCYYFVLDHFHKLYIFG